MSYGFNIRAATAAAAIAALPAKFDEVVAAQPIHERDRDAAVAAATSVIGLIGEPQDGQEISLSVSGYVQWQVPMIDGKVDGPLTGASVSANAILVAKTE